MLPSGKIALFAIKLFCPYYNERNRNSEDSEEKGTRLNTRRKVRKSRFQDPRAQQKYECSGMLTRSQGRESAHNLAHHTISEEGDSIIYRDSRREQIYALPKLCCFQVPSSMKEGRHCI